MRRTHRLGVGRTHIFRAVGNVARGGLAGDPSKHRHLGEAPEMSGEVYNLGPSTLALSPPPVGSQLPNVAPPRGHLAQRRYGTHQKTAGRSAAPPAKVPLPFSVYYVI